MNILVSACLLGACCRYDGSGCVVSDEMQALVDRHHLIPVCPEQLGGLPTPRAPVELRGGRALTQAGQDMTAAFVRGAGQACALAKLFRCETAVLKEKSPSCGSSCVYDGSFSGRLVQGVGITAALLGRNGITVLNENNLARLID